MTFRTVRGRCARWAAIAALLTVAAGAPVLASGCGSDRTGDASATSAGRPPPDPQLMQIGRRVFHEICHNCHTLLGQRNPPMTNGEPAGASFDEVVVGRAYVEERVEHGGIAMAGWRSSMTPREFKAIVTYVTTLSGRNLRPDESDPAVLSTGEGVFVAHCNACHSIADRPQTSHVGLPGADFRRVKPSEAFVRWMVTSRYGFMEAFKDKLSPAEVAAVAKFVQANAGRR